jgi:hypothetical protein
LTGLDWIIVALVVFMAAFGWRQGFVIGVLSLAGFVGGAYLGTRLGPELLPEGSESPYAPLFGLFGALLAGAILATGLESVGLVLRERLTFPGLQAFDGLLGAVLSAAIALGIVWIAGAVALQTPGARELRADIQRSEILSRLNDALPPSGPLLNALARFDPFPQIEGPGADDVAPPREGIQADPDIRAAERSTFRILGTACGLGVSGSGWAAGGGLVVTNAHVVAGQDDTEVQANGQGPRLRARAVAFDVRNDIAVLRVSGIGDVPALPLADDPPSGRAGAILGFPKNSDELRSRSGRLGATTEVLAQDALGQGPVRRRITALRGLVQSGNSGGPMVDIRGRVITTIFAATRGGGPNAGYGVPNDVVARVLAQARGREGTVPTGPCTS